MCVYWFPRRCLLHYPLVAVQTYVKLTAEQVLPPSMLLLAEPSPEALVAALELAIERMPHVDGLCQHHQVRRVVLGTASRPPQSCPLDKTIKFAC